MTQLPLLVPTFVLSCNGVHGEVIQHDARNGRYLVREYDYTLEDWNLRKWYRRNQLVPATATNCDSMFFSTI